MKRIALSVTLLILTVVIVTGCGGGISEDSYNALEEQLSSVQADLVNAQQNLTTVTADRDSIQSQLDKASADLAAAQANLNKSNADLATAQQSFSTLNTSIKVYQPYVDASALWLDAYVNMAGWDEGTWTAWRANMATVVSSTPELKAAWDKIRNTTGAEHIAAEDAFSQLLLQRLTESKPKTN